MTRSFVGWAGLGQQVELLQLPGRYCGAEQLHQLVPQVPIQFVQLCQLFQQLSEQLLFVGDVVDRRGHGGGDEGVVELLQLYSDLGLLQHEDEQLGLEWGHLLLPPWSEPIFVHLCQSPGTAGVGDQLAIG